MYLIYRLYVSSAPPVGRILNLSAGTRALWRSSAAVFRTNTTTSPAYSLITTGCAHSSLYILAASWPSRSPPSVCNASSFAQYSLCSAGTTWSTMRCQSPRGGYNVDSSAHGPSAYSFFQVYDRMSWNIALVVVLCTSSVDYTIRNVFSAVPRIPEASSERAPCYLSALLSLLEYRCRGVHAAKPWILGSGSCGKRQLDTAFSVRIKVRLGFSAGWSPGGAGVVLSY